MEEKQSNKEILTGPPGLLLPYKIRLGAAPDSPLFFLVHGRAGNFDVMWTFARCVPPEAAIVTPQALLDDPVMPHSPSGKSWWMSNPPEGIVAAGGAAADLLEKFIAQVEERHHLRPRKRIAFGFSQGAATLSYLLQKSPAIFRGVALLAGFVIEDRGAEGVINGSPDLLIVHGTKDEVVPLDKAEKGRDYLLRRGAATEFHSEDVGHKVGSQGMRVVKEWAFKMIKTP